MPWWAKASTSVATVLTTRRVGLRRALRFQWGKRLPEDAYMSPSLGVRREDFRAHSPEPPRRVHLPGLALPLRYVVFTVCVILHV